LLYLHSRFIGINALSSMVKLTTYSGIIVAYNYRKRPKTLPKSKTFFKVNINTIVLKLTLIPTSKIHDEIETANCLRPSIERLFA
jgi:hypothetical protein